MKETLSWHSSRAIVIAPVRSPGFHYVALVGGAQIIGHRCVFIVNQNVHCSITACRAEISSLLAVLCTGKSDILAYQRVPV